MQLLSKETVVNNVLCANCQKPVSSYDHIIKEKSTMTTKWSCGHCKCENQIKFKDGEVISVELTGNKEIKGIGLMASEADIEGNRIFLYINVPFYPHDMVNGVLTLNDELADNKRYYYNTHTCPINWIKGDVIKITYVDDGDPHGLFTLIGLWELSVFRETVAEDDDRHHALFATKVLKTYEATDKVVITSPDAIFI